MAGSPETSIGHQSKFEYIKANNGHLNIVWEAVAGSFAGLITTKEDVRHFVNDLQKHIRKGLKQSNDSDKEALEIAGSVVGQTLGLNKDHPRSYFWLQALIESPQEDIIRETYKTFASTR